jgi:hypothetical protein
MLDCSFTAFSVAFVAVCIRHSETTASLALVCFCLEISACGLTLQHTVPAHLTRGGFRTYLCICRPLPSSSMLNSQFCRFLLCTFHCCFFILVTNTYAHPVFDKTQCKRATRKVHPMLHACTVFSSDTSHRCIEKRRLKQLCKR